MSLRELLFSWNMPEDIIKHFEDEQFTVNSILTLEMDYIKSIFIKEGPRSEFVYHWKALKNKLDANNVEDFDLTQPIAKKLRIDENEDLENHAGVMNIASLSNVQVVGTFENPVISHESLIPQNVQSNTVNLKNFYSVDMSSDYDLHSILNASSKGQCALGFYTANKYLDNSHRTKLAFCVIENELRNTSDKCVTVDRLKYLANQIVLKFQSELVITWFDDTGTSSKGKLYVQYHSIRRSLRKSGAITDSPRSHKKSKTLIEQREDVSHYILWLSNNTGPKQTLDDYWEKTYAYRINDLIKNRTPIYEYYQKYPALNSSNGYTLLEIDYDHMYPNTSLDLYTQWPSLCRFVIDGLQKTKLSSSLKKSVDKFFDLTEDEKVVFLFSHIHSLFPVITAVNKNKKSWRPSREEMRESFILHVKSYDDIKVQIASRKAKLLKWDLTLQPMTVIVGPSIDNITQRYVVIDDNFYSIESTIKAIDITFKSFQSLQALYPPESEQTWLFLQRGIYDITTLDDKPFSEAKAKANEYQILYPRKKPSNSSEIPEAIEED